MIYNIKAIPTTYAGVQFRSRLEARWAAFFDICGWAWDYEPFDLDGWAPDFMLKGAQKSLVEVKTIEFCGPEKQLYRQALAGADKAFDISMPRANGAPPQYETMVVGNGPFKSEQSQQWSLGVITSPKKAWDEIEAEIFAEHANDATFGSDIADLYAGKSVKFDYAARWGSYRYRIGGLHDGDKHLTPIADDTPLSMWREAGNIVQWRGPKRRAA
jgi:hypothetical protein